MGNGNSANDMAAHIAQMYPDPHAYDDDTLYQEIHQQLRGSRPEPHHQATKAAASTDLGPVRVYRSVRSEASPMFPSLKDHRIEDVPEIASVTVRNGKMDVELLGGRVLAQVDAILYGTGYDGYRYPYARVWSRPLSSTEAETITQRVQRLLDPTSLEHRQTVQELDHAAIRAYDQGTAHDPFQPDNGQPAYIQELERILWGSAWADAWTSLHPEPRGTIQEELNPAAAQGAPWSPARIVGIHKHTLFARNPSLAFAGLPVSFTPFTTVDGYLWYVRSLWDGSIDPLEVGLGTDYGQRLTDETDRIQLLRQTQANNSAAPIPPANAGSRTGWIPPPPGGNTSFHLVAPEEVELLSKHLADPVLRVKPWLRGKLDPYSNEQREAERSGQYEVKRRTLAEYAVRGLGQVGPSGPVPGVGVAVKGRL